MKCSMAPTASTLCTLNVHLTSLGITGLGDGNCVIRYCHLCSSNINNIFKLVHNIAVHNTGAFRSILLNSNPQPYALLARAIENVGSITKDTSSILRTPKSVVSHSKTSACRWYLHVELRCSQGNIALFYDTSFS